MSEPLAGQEREPRSSVGPERFCCDDYLTIPVGRDEWMVYGRTSRQLAVLKGESVATLSRCREFRTVDDHARELAIAGRSGPESLAKRPTDADRLSILTTSGLLIRHSDVLARLACGKSAPGDGSRIETLGVVTRDRPETLSRCLESYAQNVREWGRQLDIVVVDDSREAETQERNRRVLSHVHKLYGLPVWYAGPAEKQKYADALAAEAGCPTELVGDALLPARSGVSTCGANRNALQLATVGRLVVSVDDDTVCRVVESAERPPEVLRIAASRDVHELHFFGTRDEALAWPTRSEFDLLGAHERLLGRALSDCTWDWGMERVWIESLPAWLTRVLGRRSGTVCLTSPGIVGDCGSEVADWNLLLRGPSHERLVRTSDRYRQFMSGSPALRVAIATNVTAAGGWMGYCMGIDNRRLTPPFMPVGRNQDGLFFAAVLKCSSSALAAHLPAAITHLRASRAGAERLPIGHGLVLPRICDIMTAVIEGRAPAISEDPAVNMTRIGEQMEALGGLASTGFAEEVRQSCWRVVQGHVLALERQREDLADAPSYWRSDVAKAIEFLLRAAEDPTWPQALDLGAKASSEQARHLEQAHFRAFGWLLAAWPQLFEAARRLSDRGRGLAAPIT